MARERVARTTPAVVRRTDLRAMMDGGTVCGLSDGSGDTEVEDQRRQSNGIETSKLIQCGLSVLEGRGSRLVSAVPRRWEKSDGEDKTKGKGGVNSLKKEDSTGRDDRHQARHKGGYYGGHRG